jgi:rubredoxin
MSQWRCTTCGYLYDEAVGDPENDVAPGTAWADVPEDWLCPNCGMTKEFYERVD